MQRNTLPGQYTGFGEPVYPSYQKRSLYVHGFDDTKLAVDIIRPVNEDGTVAPGPFPAILLISRGGRFEDITDASGPDIIHHCVPYGYVGVVAEMRGCGTSYGTNDSFCSIDNRQDVTCILNWIEAQEWSNGKVATYGGSNRGLIQFASAVAKPAPGNALKAITPVVANPDFYYQDYPNGVSALPRRRTQSGSRVPKDKLSKEELLKIVVPVDDDPDGTMAYEAYESGQYGKNHAFMGWLLLEDMCRDDPNPNLNGEQTNLTIPPDTDLDVFKNSEIKVHQFAGFIESGAFGQLMAAKEWGGSIIIGPWDHRESRRGTKGFPEGEFDFKSEHLKWFDAVLKDKDNGYFRKPPFIYYTQQAKPGEYWRCSDTWPLETVRPMTLYLSGKKSGSIASVNDGSLVQHKPEETVCAEYQVDTSIQVFDNGDGGTMDRMHLTWDGNMAEGVDKKGLTFTSAPLFKMYENEMTGETSVDLWVTCTQKDVDFIVYLEEVMPDGTSKYVSFGCQRASHRTSVPRKAWNECGAYYHPCMRSDMEACLEEGMDNPVHLQFHIEPVSYVFQKGSRIRITITCANDQCFQHNMYDPENLPEIRLYQGGELASFVRIPFIEHTENVYNGIVEMGEYEGPGSLYFFKEHTYLYCDGIWHKFRSDSSEMEYEMKDGAACFKAGFRFRQEGYPVMDGILQDYRGGDKGDFLFPAKRSLYLDRVPVSVREDILFVPDSKTLYLEVFRSMDGSNQAPCIVYIHGYSATPSMIRPQIIDFIKNGYTVVSIDLRPYPPNCFPDYIYDIKANIRYIRAHAKELGIDPDRIGCYGQSLGGNSALMLAASGSVKELEGNVGGNEGFSSRVQAAAVGFGWSDLLYMGKDLLDEYSHAGEELKLQKFKNTDGPFSPLAQVIGFAGEGKGVKVLRDYMESGKEGSDPEMDEMLNRARAASPVNYIGPDCPPMVLYAGLGMTRVDIPNRQTYRTFEQCNRYGADCFMFSNTNGEYGMKPEIKTAIRFFFDRHLKNGPVVKKSVMVPGSSSIVEDYKDRMMEYPPAVKTDQNQILVSVNYVKERFQMEISGEMEINGQIYAGPDRLVGTGIGMEYYPDKDMAVLAPISALQEKTAPNREGK